jgi:biofilm PGA synthesis N-glycosyltransferase PgaC
LVTLTPSEADFVGEARYVIQQYGYPKSSPSTGKVLMLTFDDGPDPIWTPKLLDVLSRWHVPATFFVTGEHAAAYPQIMERMVREGHAVGNHTLTHPDVSAIGPLRGRAEFVLTDRVIQASGGVRSAMARLPYDSDGDVDRQTALAGILRAQQWGYVVSSYDVDSLDWRYELQHKAIPLVPLTEQFETVLLHDSGAKDRQATIDYVNNVLIPEAKRKGYTFQTMPQALPDLSNAMAKVGSDATNNVSFWAVTMWFVWPDKILAVLFGFAVIAVLGISLGAASLAIYRYRHRPIYPDVLPVLPVTVLLAAYNEEKVIARTLRTLATQSYPILEILVIDDGSTDGTAEVVRGFEGQSPVVRLIQQQNAGKWAALNRGIRYSRGEILVTLDADTIFAPNTVANLVRQFAFDRFRQLGAVAGVVRVGNRERNLLTRWQSLEYLLQIGVERAAYAHLRAVPVVPGACAAWRKQAVVQVGGYSGATLAEDCDLTLALREAGWVVGQDDEATALTEAPEDVESLLAQRVRWTFGTIQSLYKHRRMMFRRDYGWLGMLVLPYTLISILVPVLFIPFVTVMTIRTLQAGASGLLIAYFLAFMAVHIFLAWVAARLMGEKSHHLPMVVIYRLVYEPLRAYLLYTSVYLAIRGVRQGWNKLRRTGLLDVDPGSSGAVTEAADGGRDAVAVSHGRRG